MNQPITHHAVCLECGWSMVVDDADDADIMLEVHRIVKLNDAMQEDA